MDKEKEVKEFMIGKFVPALRRVLAKRERIPRLFEKRYGNCCNQTALLSCMHLTKVLPDYTWTMFEGMFRIVNKEKTPMLFNHAWVFGYRGKGSNLFLNLAEDGERITWESVEENRYPAHCAHTWYAQEICPYRKRIDWEQMSQRTGEGSGEYYTGLSAKSLYDLVMQEANSSTSTDMTWYAVLVQMRADELRKRGFEL